MNLLAELHYDMWHVSSRDPPTAAQFREVTENPAALNLKPIRSWPNHALWLTAFLVGLEQHTLTFDVSWSPAIGIL